MVVDLAIEDDGQQSLLSGHRLGTPREIDNRKPPVTEMNPPVLINEKTLRIRSPVGQRTGHPLQKIPSACSHGADESSNPAHQRGGRFFVAFTR